MICSFFCFVLFLFLFCLVSFFLFGRFGRYVCTIVLYVGN